MESEQAEFFKVLVVDTRIRIIELLKQKGPLGSNEMAEKKDSDCGCGCLPEPKKGSKTAKPEVKKSEKPKS
jgi:hypothetical protein